MRLVCLFPAGINGVGCKVFGMAHQSYYYSRTPLSDITGGLNRIFSSLRLETGDSYVRSAASNMIIPVASADVLNELDGFIDDLTLFHPSRFFVLVRDGEKGEIKADITARCHGLTAAQHVCCEVVRLFCPESKMAALPELVRANLVPGMSTQIFLYDPKVSTRLVDTFVPLSDQIIFDSSDFEGRIELVSHLVGISSNLVDMQWVSLGLWREQIRAAFESPSVQAQIGSIESIVIGGECSAAMGASGQGAIAMLLLAGWFVDRLGLEVFGCNASGFDCYTPQGKLVKLVLDEKKAANSSRMMRVEILFRKSAGEASFVSLKRADKLEVAINMDESISWSCYFEDESRWGLVKRYFQIGEIFSNYYNSLCNAVDLRSLRGDED